MSKEKTAFKIEQLEIKARMVYETMTAIIEAIQYGSRPVNNYEWALNLLENTTLDLCKQAENIKNQAFEELKQAKQTERR